MNQTPTNPIKKTNWKLRLFVIFILFGILVVYSKILVLQIRQRAYITSVSSVLAVRTIPVGVADYGQITDMNVEVGSNIKQGEKLFTYLKSGSQSEEVIVRSAVSGIVKEIFNDLGSYITRDDKVLSIQSDSVRIRSEFPISPEQISSIKIGNETITTIPGNGQFNGTTSLIYPVYNSEKKLLQVDSILEKNPVGVLEGVPVQTKIYVGDDIASSVNNVIAQIPFSIIRDYFNK